MSRVTDSQEDIHQHSGWLIPLGILVAIVLLSAIFLLYDLRPALGPREGARSGDPTPVHFAVRGLKFTVPANYLESAAARGGGDTDTLALAALLPDMRGYSQGDAVFFAGNAPDSPVVHLLFKGDENDLDAPQRLARIYMPYVIDPPGRGGPFGLIQYAFRANSGYDREDLFAGQVGGRLVLFLCERADPTLAAPNCLAVARPVARRLSFSYRFKRAYLSRWHGIVTGVDDLVARFQAR